MTNLENAAIEWFYKRQAFLDAENKAGTPEFRELLNRCADGEHALAAAVREYIGNRPGDEGEYVEMNVSSTGDVELLEQNITLRHK